MTKDLMDKVDKILEELNEIKVVLGRHQVLHEKNSESLDYHIKRTDNAEKYIKEVYEEVHVIEEKLENKISKLSSEFHKEKNSGVNRRAFYKGAAWIIGIIFAIIIAILQTGIFRR
jgi:hypothetical protein